MSTSQLSPPSSCDSEDEHTKDVLDLNDDEGWEDMEPDVEKIQFVSLFGDAVFDDAQPMLQHCKENHDFDIMRVQKDLSELSVYMHQFRLVNKFNYVPIQRT